MKKTLFIAAVNLAILFCACGGNPDLKNPEEVKNRSEQQVVTGGTASEDLKANAIDVNDTEKLIKWSLGRVQEELKKSEGTIEELGEVSVLLDENMQMVIRNNKDGNVYEKRVKLSSLNTDINSFQIVVDNDTNPYPGFKMPVVDGQPGVDHYENGKKKETKKDLEIFLAERRQVQLVISAMIQAAQTAKGEL